MYRKHFTLALLFTTVWAKPIYVGTPLTGLEHAYLGVNLHHFPLASGLISQPFAMLENSDQKGSTLSKGLLSPDLGGQKFSGLPIPFFHPTTLALTSPQLHHAIPVSFPIKKEMEFPEKTVAGALIKQVPKVSKLPISISYSPKSLGYSSIAQTGILGGLSRPVLSDKSFLNGFGISYGF